MCLFVADKPLQTKEDPEYVPEEPAEVEEPVSEAEVVPTVELKVWSRVSCILLDRFVHHCLSIGGCPSRDQFRL